MQGLEFCGLVYNQQHMILHLRLLWILVHMVSLARLLCTACGPHKLVP